MAGKFIDAAGLPPATNEQLQAFMAAVVTDGVAFIAPKGMIAGAVVPLMYRPDYLEAHEIAWWSEGGSGLGLVRAFEEWAREQGVQQIVFSTLPGFTGDAAGKWLQRKGYALREQSYRQVA